MFKVTEAAAAQVKQAANQSGTEGMALRLAAQQKQDGSIEYLMGFDETRENDIRIDWSELDRRRTNESMRPVHLVHAGQR